MKLSEEFTRRAEVFRNTMYHSDAKEMEMFADIARHLEADAELSEQDKADLILGRLVRKMPPGMSIKHCALTGFEPKNHEWVTCYFPDVITKEYKHGNTPEEALRKALGESNGLSV